MNKMDLSNMTPKDKMMYETAMETKDILLKNIKKVFPKDKYEEIIEILYFISRAEYKRGKADGIKEGSQSPD